MPSSFIGDTKIYMIPHVRVKSREIDESHGSICVTHASGWPYDGLAESKPANPSRLLVIKDLEDVRPQI